MTQATKSNEQIANEEDVTKKITKKPRKKVNWWKVLEYSLPALISMAIFFFAMIIKGISPFGSNHIGYIDYNDGLVPAYTKLWDVLHGQGGAFVDWNLGAGGSFVTSAVVNSFLSPISLLIGIFPRESIMHAIAFLVIVKLALMSTTAYLCFKKFFPKISQWILLLFSLTWTFSGWTLVHFTNIGWLDIMILVPLLMMAMEKLVKEGKIFWSVIVLSYMLILSYYISYMVLVGVVVIATIYICTLATEKKKVAANLFWTILISILISAFAFIPSCLTSLQGHRFESTTSAGAESLFSYFFTKLSTIIMFALPVVFFMRLLCTYKKDKKVVLFFILSFVFCSIGLIIEPINEMWHTGSYYSFPFRYCFVIIMLMIYGSLYYINKYFGKEPQENSIEETNQTKSKAYWVVALLPPILGAALVVTILLGIMATLFIPYRSMTINNAILYIILFATSYGAIELMLRLKSKKLVFGKITGGVLIFVFSLLQIFALTVGFVGLNGDSNTERITNAFNIDVSQLEQGYKIKDREANYNYNFGYLIDYPTLSTWIHISSEEQFQAYNNLGYNSSSTILFSSGGTIMTDVLLGNKYVLSLEELNDAYYSVLDQFVYVDETSKEEKIMYLYEINFDIPQAFMTNINLSQVLADSNDWFEAQNILYKSIYQGEDDIMETLENVATLSESDDEIKIEISVPTDKNIYLASSYLNKIDAKINGKERVLYYGLNDLGFVENGKIEIIIDNSAGDYDIETLKSIFTYGGFDFEKFATANNNMLGNYDVKIELASNSISVVLQNNANYKYVFVPFVNLKNMVATNNGETVIVANGLTNFMFIELKEGENNITISYQPQYLKICCIVTLISIAIFALFSILNWKFKLSNNKVLIWIGFIGACAIVLAVGVLVYAKPLLYDFFVRLF